MMPHQIYCDYLEDKGIDCRLLRIEEGNTTITNFKIDYPFDIDSYGDGVSVGDGLGDGRSNCNCDEYGWGCGDGGEFFFYKDEYFYDDYGYNEGYN